jgi:hypothetical protein
MRGALAVVVLLAGAGLVRCDNQTTCAANADCPVQSYCVLGDGGAKGTCHHDCRATPDCQDPARRCNSLGQCVPYEIPVLDAGPDDAALEPADAAGPETSPLDDAAGAD